MQPHRRHFQPKEERLVSLMPRTETSMAVKQDTMAQRGERGIETWLIKYTGVQVVLLCSMSVLSKGKFVGMG
jgi:hypothetical protein